LTLTYDARAGAGEGQALSLDSPHSAPITPRSSHRTFGTGQAPSTFCVSRCLWFGLRETSSAVIAAHLDRLVTLVRLTSVLPQHPPLLDRLLLLLLLPEVALVLVARRNTIMIGLWSDDVVVHQLTFGQELTTVCAPQTTAPALQHLHVYIVVPLSHCSNSVKHSPL